MLNHNDLALTTHHSPYGIPPLRMNHNRGVSETNIVPHNKRPIAAHHVDSLLSSVKVGTPTKSLPPGQSANIASMSSDSTIDSEDEEKLERELAVLKRKLEKKKAKRARQAQGGSPKSIIKSDHTGPSQPVQQVQVPREAVIETSNLDHGMTKIRAMSDGSLWINDVKVVEKSRLLHAIAGIDYTPEGKIALDPPTIDRFMRKQGQQYDLGTSRSPYNAPYPYTHIGAAQLPLQQSSIESFQPHSPSEIITHDISYGSTTIWEMADGSTKVNNTPVFTHGQLRLPIKGIYQLPNGGVQIFPEEIDRDMQSARGMPAPSTITSSNMEPHTPKHYGPLPPSSTTQSTPKPRAPRLCEEQQELVDLIAGGANVFYTGSAGVGKSTVLRAFVKHLKDEGKKVNIIAPTGRAALDINGGTFWTYAGWTPDHMKRPIEKLEQAAQWGKFIRKRLQNTDVLVVDEISMVENQHFERLNRVMKAARGRPEAFGGVQIVVTGDFCQLPPVKPFRTCMECGLEMRVDMKAQTYTCPNSRHPVWRDEDKWAFRSKAWEEAKFEHKHLMKIHRQNDKTFIKILQKCRLGQPFDEKDLDTLANHPFNVENAVRLFSTREEVKRINDMEFNKLKTRKVTYKTLDHFKWNPSHGHLRWKGDRDRPDGPIKGLSDHRFEPHLELKEGMLVLLLVNLSIESGLVNGSQGIITGFEPFDPKDAAKVANQNKKSDRADRAQRAGSPAGLDEPIGGEYGALKEENIKAFMEQAREREFPIVKFTNGIVRTITCNCTVNELGDEKPYSLISRTQIPLLPAWAMTVHKSQGMTLSKVSVDLSKSFEDGQIYVALSRARSLDGLEVKGLEYAYQGTGNQQVKEFLFEKFDIK